MAVSPRLRASLAYVALFAGLGGLLPYTTLYYLAHGLDYPQIGALLGVGSLTGLFAGPAWGALSDRLAGSPRVLLLSGLVALGGIGLLVLGSGFPGFLAANVVLGAGHAGLSPIIDARAIETAGVERAGYGRFRAWGSAGWVVSSLATGAAVDRVGLPVIFVVAAAGVVLTVALGLGLRPALTGAVDRPLRGALHLFARPVFLVFLAGMLLAAAAQNSGLDFLTPRFAELGAQTSLVGLSWALPAAIEVPAMLLFPALARRVGGGWLLVAGLAIVALRSGLSALAPDPWFLVLASAIGGVGYAWFLVGGVTYVAVHVPRELVATGQGVFQGVTIGLAGVLGASAGGLLAGGVGIAGMFGVAAAVGVGGTLLVAVAVLARSQPRSGSRRSARLQPRDAHPGRRRNAPERRPRTISRHA